MAFFKKPTTVEGRVKWLQTVGLTSQARNPDIVNNQARFDEHFSNYESNLQRQSTHGIGRILGQTANVLNDPRLTPEGRAKELALAGKNLTEQAGTFDQISKDFTKFQSAGILDDSAVDWFNDMLTGAQKYAPGITTKALTGGTGAVPKTDAQRIAGVTGESGEDEFALRRQQPAQAAAVPGGKPILKDNTIGGPPPGGGLKLNQLLDKALLQGGGTTDLQNQDWWKNSPDKQAAWKQLQQITGSPQGLADYVQSKGITNLQQYGWWSTSPHKQAAWDILQKQAQGQQQPQQGQQGVGQDVLAQKGAYNDQANQNQQSELDMILSQTNKVDLSSSAGLTERLIQSLEEKKTEPSVSLQQTFQDQRAALGVGELEDTMASIDSDIAKLDADFASTIPEEENRRVTVRQIRRRQSELETQYNRQRRDLLAERSSVASQLNVKLGVVNSIVKFAGMDYDNAQAKYTQDFNKAIQMINLVKGIENDQKDDEERKTDNARANVQIMTNLLKEGEINYDELDASTLTDIKNMEMQAGLPIGFTSFVHENVPDPVVSQLPSFTDVDGNRILPVMTKTADGSFSIQNITLGQVESAGQPGQPGNAGIPIIVNDAIEAGKGSFPSVGGKMTNALGTGTVTGYGSPLWEPGFDFVIDGGMGAVVPSPVSGEVVQVDTGHVQGESESFGNRVKVKLPSGEEIWLSHLQSTNVQKGDFVQAGQQIGTQGNTGSTQGKTGIHVDITMKKKSGGYYTAKEVAGFLGGVGKSSGAGTTSSGETIVSKADFQQLAQESAQMSLSPTALDNLYQEYLDAAQGQTSTVPASSGSSDSGSSSDEFRF